jgi:DNA-binding NtrC family response regulator
MPDGHVRRLAEIEAMAIERAIEVYHGRMAEVARRLGIGRSTLYRKLEELNISRARRGAATRGGVQSADGAMPRAVR